MTRHGIIRYTNKCKSSRGDIDSFERESVRLSGRSANYFECNPACFVDGQFSYAGIQVDQNNMIDEERGFKMRKNVKKFLATLVAATMILGASLPALAEGEGGQAGNEQTGGNNGQTGGAQTVGTDDEEVTISVKRDSSYARKVKLDENGNKVLENGKEVLEDDAEGNREFTWYKIFDASYISNNQTNIDGNGERTNMSRTEDEDLPDDEKGKGVAYTLKANDPKTEDKNEKDPWVDVLGTWDNTKDHDHAFEPAEGNVFFTLELSADESVYIVQAIDGIKAEEAAAWLFDNKPSDEVLKAYDDDNDTKHKDTLQPVTPESQGDYTGNAQYWAATVTKGYYLIKSSVGENLVAATTNMNIVEKNTYPTIDKKQKDEDTDNYTDDVVKVGIGDIIHYQVVVFVPADADSPITVVDKMTLGLDKKVSAGEGQESGSNQDPSGASSEGGEGTFEVTVKVGETSEGFETLPATDDEGKTNYTLNTTSGDREWTAHIEATKDTKGKYVEFTYDAVVNTSAVADLDAAEGNEDLGYKQNNVTLTYDNYVVQGNTGTENSNNEGTQNDPAAQQNEDTESETTKSRYTMKDDVHYKLSTAGVEKFNDMNKDGEKTTGVEGAVDEPNLAGAEFRLDVLNPKAEEPAWTELKVVKEEGYYRPQVTSDTGSDTIVSGDGDLLGYIVLRGLDSDKQYRLIETKAPGGFNLAVEPLILKGTKKDEAGNDVDVDSLLDDTTETVTIEETFKVTETDEGGETVVRSLVSQVANIEGTLLPSTGGVGTTIFYIIGAVLVIGAGAVLIIRRRRA